MISWGLTTWEVDLVGVDHVGVDLVRVDLVGLLCLALKSLRWHHVDSLCVDLEANRPDSLSEH